MDDLFKLAKELKRPPKDFTLMVGNVVSLEPFVVAVGENIRLTFGKDLVVCNLKSLLFEGAWRIPIGQGVLIAKTDFGVEKYILIGRIYGDITEADDD